MERILQFGEGNFLRAFAEEYIQDSGYGEVAITQPRTNDKIINALNNQDCEYDIIFRGRLNGKIVDDRKHISCVSRAIDSARNYDELEELFCSSDLEIVISNTTEAGICFVAGDYTTFPSKLARLLAKREYCGIAPLIFLPVELIENNGDELKRCITLYADDFGLSLDYINSCTFCNTLVDRIVTGHSADDDDPCSVTCEPYRSWIIQADKRTQNALPRWDVTYTDDLVSYRTRKVRILNGTHTMSVLAAYLCGIRIVRDMMNDDLFSRYIALGLDEIKSTLSIPADDFASSVVERFDNPFIDHRLWDISLNSVAKFRARCLDTIFDYHRMNGEYPKVLTFALSALIAFYKYEDANDSRDVVDFIMTHTISDILSNADMWGADLSPMCEIVEKNYDLIERLGMRGAVLEVVNGCSEA